MYPTHGELGLNVPGECHGEGHGCRGPLFPCFQDNGPDKARYFGFLGGPGLSWNTQTSWSPRVDAMT